MTLILAQLFQAVFLRGIFTLTLSIANRWTVLLEIVSQKWCYFVICTMNKCLNCDSWLRLLKRLLNQVGYSRNASQMAGSDTQKEEMSKNKFHMSYSLFPSNSGWFSSFLKHAKDRYGTHSKKSTEIKKIVLLDESIDDIH